jgi:L-aspartate oxidase
VSTTQQFDALVIGSGIAGLSFALKCAEAHPHWRIGIITKAGASESNTKYAQGGIAVVTEQTDDFEEHVADTLRAGDGLCDEAVVRMVVTEGPARLAELVAWGTHFDEENGRWHLGREGGHTANRILHHKDLTGLEIERKLLQRVQETGNIEVFTHHFALELITRHQVTDAPVGDPLTCFGAYVFNRSDGKIAPFAARITLLATGGAGQVYRNTTNPLIATGDGIAMAYRAKAAIKHLEFVQFHPTALYDPAQEGPAFLISEAVRGHGAYLRNGAGERFAFRFDERGEMASRDIVSRAIDAEMKRTGSTHLWLDCTHLDQTDFEKHFPTIVAECRKRGWDLSKDLIPVVPAAHYLCGGIQTDANGQTTIRQLLAAGECAHTGLHGANRLASNSLLEAVVFAHRCFETAKVQHPQARVPANIPQWNEEGTVEPSEGVLISHNRREIQLIMADFVGIIRTTERLERAESRLALIYSETETLYKRSKISYELAELRNILSVAWLMVQHSKARKHSAGVFFRA